MKLTSAHWGTYQLEIKNNTVVGLKPFPFDRDPSEIGQSILDLLDGPTRIKAPMVRESWYLKKTSKSNKLRGQDCFIPITWEEAINIVAGELRRVIDEHGNSSIYAGSYGWASAGRFHHAQSQIHRFLNCLGGYTKSVNTYSYAAAEVILPHVIGANAAKIMTQQTSWSSIVNNAKLMVSFGGFPTGNSQISNGGVSDHIQVDFLRQASSKGISLISIAPRQSIVDKAEQIEWIKARPNSDTALILGICHTLLQESLYNINFLKKFTVGYEKFFQYLTGQSDGVIKNADWAEQLSGVSSSEIMSLARKMAKTPTMLSITWSLTRQENGEQAYWAVIALAAMLGQMGKPGLGIGFGYTVSNYLGNNVRRLPFEALPQGKNKVDDFIPVARLTDMLLNPGKSFDFNGEKKVYPKIDLIYWAGGNPFHHHQDLNRLVDAWQKPSTIIVNEWCWNSLAKHADIVLPCTTMLERNDLGMTPRDPFVIAMSKAFEPIGQARDDYEIFTAIAEKLDIKEEFTEGRSAADWLEWIWDQSRKNTKKTGINMPSYKQFITKGWYQAPSRETDEILLADFFRDPVAFPLSTPSGKIEIFSEVVAAFNYDGCAGHPTWIEPTEWLGAANKQHPFHLISIQPETKLHGQLDNGKLSLSAKINGHEIIEINPVDATAKNLKNSDTVRVFNQRGTCYCGVKITDDVMPGVVVIRTGSWYDPASPGTPMTPCKHGNPNVLTPDIGTSKIAQGPAAHSCLVNLEKYHGSPLQITAHEPPKINRTAAKNRR